MVVTNTLNNIKLIYKVTKIVRALWLAVRNVCMRVCKHGCHVRCFAFRALITQARIWKSLVIKTRQVYFIYPFLRRLKLGKSLQTSCVNFFFAKADILSEKNPYFGKHLFAKQELITRARLRVQDFGTGKNFCFNQCHIKSFWVLCKPSTSSRVCITVSNSPNPSRVYIRLCKHGKRFLLLK